MKPRRLAVVFNRSGRARTGRRGFTNHTAHSPSLRAPASPIRLGAGVVTCLAAIGAFLVLAASPASANQIHVFSTSFGGEGSGAGQLDLAEHSGVAVSDASGDVYIADTLNHRVAEFDPGKPEGERFVRAFGADVGGPGVGTCTATCFEGTETAVAGGFERPRFIAVDNSTDPSVGDVYVGDSRTERVSKFDASGSLVATWGVGGLLAGFSGLAGIAVDPTGNLWVYDESAQMREYSQSGALLTEWNTEIGVAPGGIALDAADNVYLFRGSEQVAKFSSSGTPLIKFFDAEPSTGVAVDPLSADVFVDHGSEILHYTSSGERQDSFSSELSTAQGLAVDTSHFVYAANQGTANVSVFEPVLTPTVVTAEATETAVEGTATLNGTVDPEGLAATECRFEYGLTIAYGELMPCSSVPGTGSSPEPVSAELAGLPPGRYHFRLAAVNEHGETFGADRTVVATGTPAIAGEETGPVFSTTADLTAEISPGGLPTSYSVEYGTSTTYGSSTSVLSLGLGFAPSGVQVSLSGLLPGVIYHARFVASNSRGIAMGPDISFQAGSGSNPASENCPNAFNTGFSDLLPDCRAYEFVSGAAGEGEVYVPQGPQIVSSRKEDIPAVRPLRASSSENSVSYVGEPSEEGGGGSVGRGIGEQFLATRSESGWKATNITPSPTAPEFTSEPGYQSFTADLSVGVVESRIRTLAAESNPPGPVPCFVLYTRTGGPAENTYHALFSESKVSGECGAGETNRGSQSVEAGLFFDGGNAGTPLVPAFTYLLLQTPAAITQTAEPLPPGEGANLYLSVAGKLTDVNVLENGTRPPAVIGAPAPPSTAKVTRPDLQNAISADGSHVYWTDTTTGRIYLQIDGETSEPVSAGAASYYSASFDGRFAVYLEGERLLRFDSLTGTSEVLASEGLSHEPARVKGVLGSSEDTSYVYFVAEGALAAGAHQRLCQAAAQGGGAEEEEWDEERHGHLPNGRGCNLYVEHAGVLQYITALSALDNEFVQPLGANTAQLGDWQGEMGSRTAEVSEGGAQLVFESTQQLTGYDNSSLTFTEGENGAAKSYEHAVEIFVYNFDPTAVRIACASCSPAGLPPARESAGENETTALASGTYLRTSGQATFMPRSISADGNRVFFDTAQPLVTRDTNRAQDVYEWEREGTAGCPGAINLYGGCVSLLSGGNSPDLSFFVDASSDGDDVFFTHRGSLGGVGSTIGAVGLFDARVDGGFAAPSTTCSGASCPDSSIREPATPSPASADFTGPGNFHSSLKGQRSQALRKCRNLGNRKKRVSCERRVKRRFKNHGPAAESLGKPGNRRNDK